MVRRVWSLLHETFEGYAETRGNLMAAALAFYTQLAIAPLILIGTTIAAFVLGAESARAAVSSYLTQVLGPSGARSVDALVDASVDVSAKSGGILASTVGVGLLAFTISRLVAQLRRAMNQICAIDEVSAGAFEFSIASFVRRRFFAFALVLAAVPLLLVVVVSRVLLSALNHVLFDDSTTAALVAQGSQIVFSILVVGLLAAALFRVLPDVRIRWSSIAIGAGATTLLFNFGNIVIGVYFGSAPIATTYGAAGSLVVVPLWLKFSASVFLCGVKLASVHAQQAERRGADSGVYESA